LHKKKTLKTHKNPELSLNLTKPGTAHMCMLITAYNCGTQYSTEQFW